MISKSQERRLKIQKKNTKKTSSKKILAQMAEPRPLPMGKNDFEEWSDRIISGALIPNSEGKVFQIAGLEAWDEDSEYSKHHKSQKYALAQMIMHLGPTESHKPDAFFIHQLRKGAVNQVAYAFIKKCDDEKKAKLEAEKQKECVVS